MSRGPWQKRQKEYADRLGELAGSSTIDPSTGNVVAVCFWEGCDAPAPIARELGLQPAGSRVVRPPMKIPLCSKHWLQVRDTGRLRLFTHPDNLAGM